MYSTLADLVALLHAAYILFVVGGQALILAGWARDWSWTRGFIFRVSHMVAIAVVVLESWLGGWCPLTVLEGYLRRLAGEAGYETSFIGYWLDRLIFFAAPAWLFSLVYSLFGLLVAASFVGYPPRRRGRHW